MERDRTKQFHLHHANAILYDELGKGTSLAARRGRPGQFVKLVGSTHAPFPTITDAAEHLRCSCSTVRRLLKGMSVQGLPGVKLRRV
jgi:hypothetical protein